MTGVDGHGIPRRRLKAPAWDRWTDGWTGVEWRYSKRGEDGVGVGAGVKGGWAFGIFNRKHPPTT